MKQSPQLSLLCRCLRSSSQHVHSHRFADFYRHSSSTSLLPGRGADWFLRYVLILVFEKSLIPTIDIHHLGRLPNYCYLHAGLYHCYLGEPWLVLKVRPHTGVWKVPHTDYRHSSWSTSLLPSRRSVSLLSSFTRICSFKQLQLRLNYTTIEQDRNAH